MGADPFDLYHFELEQHSGNKPVAISFDIKYYPIIANRKGVREVSAQMIKVLPGAFAADGIPRL